MTKEEQNKAILKACGWEGGSHWSCELVYGYWRNKKFITEAPNYCEDLNAIHQAIKYARETYTEVGGEGLFWCDGNFMIEINIVLDRAHYDNDLDLVLISAEKLSEAFLRNLDLWEEK